MLVFLSIGSIIWFALQAKMDAPLQRGIPG